MSKYEIIIYWSDDDKGFVAEMLELKGCTAHGDTYNEALKEIQANKPQLFICGHSHILKVMYDDKYKLLHINPGAAGNHGFHSVKTLVRFTIDGDKIKDLEVIELGKRA